MLITQALAEIKLIDSKVSRATAEAAAYSHRRGDQVDPLAKNSGSTEFVKGRLQSIRDQYDTLVTLRNKIRKINEKTMLTVFVGEKTFTKTVADWLVWKREVAVPLVERLTTILQTVATARAKSPIRATTDGPEPVISHIDEKSLMEEMVSYKTTLGVLDGELSVINATTSLE